MNDQNIDQENDDQEQQPGAPAPKPEAETPAEKATASRPDTSKVRYYEEQRVERTFVIDPDTGRRVYLDADGIEGEQPEHPEPVRPSVFPPLPDPAFELAVPETLTSSQREVAGVYGEEVAVLATEAGLPPSEAQEIFSTGDGHRGKLVRQRW